MDGWVSSAPVRRYPWEHTRSKSGWFSAPFLFGAFLSHLILAKCIWPRASGAEECPQWAYLFSGFPTACCLSHTDKRLSASIKPYGQPRLGYESFSATRNTDESSEYKFTRMREQWSGNLTDWQVAFKLTQRRTADRHAQRVINITFAEMQMSAKRLHAPGHAHISRRA